MGGFAIAALPVAGGTLALSPLPEGEQPLAALTAFAPALVVTLTETAEMQALGAAGLPDRLARAGIAWLHWPVADYGVPGAGADRGALTARILAVLSGGGRVLVHCRGGCGRSGMVALAVMTAAGEDPAAALARLRAVRPCAIETEAQMSWAVTPPSP